MFKFKNNVNKDKEAGPISEDQAASPAASDTKVLRADAEDGPSISEAPGEEKSDPHSLNVDLPPEDMAKLQALRSKMVSAAFGEIITLLMRSSHYRHYSLADLDWLVIPPLMTNQFLVVEAQVKAPDVKGDAQVDGLKSDDIESTETSSKPTSPGVRIPVGVALWAKVSPEVDEKLSSNLDTPIKLRPDEWRSGEINWLIEILGDQKIMQGLYTKLKDDVFKGQTFKVRAQGEDGKRIIREVGGGSPRE